MSHNAPPAFCGAVLDRYATSPEDFQRATRVVHDARTRSLGPHQVLLRVHATSVNQADVKLGLGMAAFLPFAPRPPFALGVDFAGHVVAVGDKCERLRPGEAVYGYAGFDHQGTMADYAVVSEASAALKPPSLTFAEAASIPLAGMTSLAALSEQSGNRVREGSRVLVLGGTSATGSLGIQIARALGAAEVSATCSAAHAGLVRGLGAGRVVDYRTQKWWSALPLASEADKYDVIYDCIGGSEPWPHAGDALRGAGGRDGLFLSLQSDYKGHFTPLTVLRILGSLLGRKIWGLFSGPSYALVQKVTNSRVDLLDRLTELVEEGEVKPVVDRVYALSEVGLAMRHVAEWRAHGKVVIAVSDKADARF